MMLVFFSNTARTNEIYALSLHDALPIWARTWPRCTRSCGDASPTGASPTRTCRSRCSPPSSTAATTSRSEEHTSELQSRRDLVCRLLLEKKNEYLSRICPVQLCSGV